MRICEKDCPERKPGCHDTCKHYKEKIEELHAKKAYVKEQNKVRQSSSLDEAESRALYKYKGRKGYRG